MGCELTKLATSQKQTSEKIKPESNDAVEQLPLSAKQKYAITANWRAVARAMESTGVYMFLKLFENNTELLDMFTKFKNLKTKEEQASSQELQEHAIKVMNTLDEGIKGLENVDNLLTFLHQVGASHTKFPGFNRDYFWKIEEPFLEAVKMTLGDRYTENMEIIYKETIKFIIKTLVEGFDKAQKEKGCIEATDAGKTQERKVPSDTAKS